MKFKDLNDPKVIWGILFGVVISLIVGGFCNNENLLKVENQTIQPVFVVDSKDSLLTKSNSRSETITTTINKIDSLQEDLLNERNIYNEKINSIHQRFNDLYAFGAIVITLLLLINISVAVRAKSETKQFLDDNFKELQSDIEKYLAEAKRLVGEIQTEYDLAQKKSKGVQGQEE